MWKLNDVLIQKTNMIFYHHLQMQVLIYNPILTTLPHARAKLNIHPWLFTSYINDSVYIYYYVAMKVCLFLHSLFYSAFAA